MYNLPNKEEHDHKGDITMCHTIPAKKIKLQLCRKTQERGDYAVILVSDVDLHKKGKV